MTERTSDDSVDKALEAFCPSCGLNPHAHELRIEPVGGDEARRCSYCYMELRGNNLRVTGSNHEEVTAVATSLAKDAQGYIGVGEHLNSAKGLLYLIVGGALIASLCFIGAGLALVYLGATGDSSVELFGSTISSENAGIVSIFFGAVTLVLVFRQAMQKIEAILRIQRGPNDR